MSHITKVQTKIKDLDALQAAAPHCRLELVRNQHHYRWFGQFMGDSPLPEGVSVADLGHCDHVLRVQNNSRAYEIGLVEQADGSYEMRYDFFAGGYGLEDAAGAGCEKLLEAYRTEKVRVTLDQLGWYNENQSDGSTLVYIPGGGTVTVSKDGQIEANNFTGSACESATQPLIEALGVAAEVTRKPEYAQVQINIGQGGN